ncbi:MAG: hypothetical protein ACJ76F_03440, partial [Bacteroidia bacterium]
MKKILLALLVIVAGYSNAQNGFTKYTCTTAGAATTFTNRSCLFIDNTGSQWIGFSNAGATAKKLIKYDGTNWTDYSSAVTAGALKIRAITQDNLNNIWIASDQGLYMYNGASFTNYSTSNSGIVSNDLYSVAVNGTTVICGSYNGFSTYNSSIWSVFSKANSGLSSDSVLCIKVENSSTIWLGTNYGLNLYDGNTTVINKGLPYKINCMEIDAASDKWLGTASSGIFKYNGTSFQDIHSIYGSSLGVKIPRYCFSMCGGPNNSIWVPVEHSATNSIAPNGLIRFSLDGTAKSYIYSSPFSNFSNNDTYLAYSSLSPDTIFFTNRNVALTTTKQFLCSFDSSGYISAPLAISEQNTDFLDINEVKAGISCNADMHWDNVKSLYEVPKGSGLSPLFNSSFWIGAYHNGTDLHQAAMTYRQSGMDFWPGPLTISNDSTDYATALSWNKVWKINRFDIENFKYNYLAGNIQAGTYTIPNAILTWPAFDMDGDFLAPFYDNNNDFWYDPQDGDYPIIKGDQEIAWVFNDKLYNHTETSANSLGIQVFATAYAYTCPFLADSDKVLNYTTFYNLRITNKSQNIYDSVYIGIRADTDLGNFTDDMIGCNVGANFGYVY